MLSTCPQCGATLDAPAHYCTYCGKRLVQQPPVITALKTFWAVCLIILALPFGLFGACGLLRASFMVLEVFTDPSHAIGIFLTLGLSSVMALVPLALALWLVRQAQHYLK